MKLPTAQPIIEATMKTNKTNVIGVAYDGSAESREALSEAQRLAGGRRR